MVMDITAGEVYERGQRVLIKGSQRHLDWRAWKTEAITNDHSPRRRSRRLNKKGFFYFVEVALIGMLLITFFFVFSPKAETSYQGLQDARNLKQAGYGTLKSLDDTGVLSAYIDPSTMANSNFAALKTYISAALPEAVYSQIEYAESSTSCYSETGVSRSCGLNVTNLKADVIRADYTYSKRPSPITIHIFLWRAL
ncbi:MAG: hypothetical protein V1839_01200 [archaeon]